MVTTAPGWYPDGQGGMRWWDGAKWTEDVAPVAEAPPVQPPVVAPPVAEAPVEPPIAVEPPVAEAPVEPPIAVEPPVVFAPPGAIVPPTAVAGPPPDDTAPPAAPAERRSSPAWFVWAIVGAVVLLVIIVAVLVPMIRGMFTTADSVDEVPRPPAAEQQPEEEPSADPPSGADEQAAVAAVHGYDDAWLTADCDLYLATTTEAMRELLELADCEAFAPAAADYAGSVDGFEVTVRDVETIGDLIAVSVTESYVSRWDADGNLTPEAVEYHDRLEYLVVDVNGEWVVDDVFPE